ncbi:hypothetical protein OG21DRAFT_378312 [Imleria badia]|nr:hypothetical protein OG21DRAFT_378312 [Imleria badia]
MCARMQKLKGGVLIPILRPTQCQVRGLVCHYAPEWRTRRWGKAPLDRNSGQPIPPMTHCRTSSMGVPSTLKTPRQRRASIASAEVRSTSRRASSSTGPVRTHCSTCTPLPTTQSHPLTPSVSRGVGNDKTIDNVRGRGRKGDVG